MSMPDDDCPEDLVPPYGTVSRRSSGPQPQPAPVPEDDARVQPHPSPTPGPAPRNGDRDGGDCCKRTTVSPTIQRFPVTGTDFQKVAELRGVAKFLIEADVANTDAVRISTKQLPSDDTLNYDSLLPGDLHLWESTLPGMRMNMKIYARPVSGSQTLIVWTWQ